jgi:glycerol-3-phosphate dehydrogenase (NAD(P)+)
LVAQKYDIRARIFNGVYSVLYEDTDPHAVIREMMKVPTRFELE